VSQSTAQKDKSFSRLNQNDHLLPVLHSSMLPFCLITGISPGNAED